MIIFLLTLIVVDLTLLVIGLSLAWKKINIYLTWNTRYETVEYEQAITAPKFKRSAAPPSVTEQRGRSIKPVDDLVDLGDMDFETAVTAIEQAAE